MGPLLALFAAYVVMAFPDGIGVMSARFGMAENASTLVFLWFAILPIAAGRLCGRLGGRPRHRRMMCTETMPFPPLASATMR